MELFLKALLSGAFAGGVAILVTVAIERLGGIFGSVLGTTPTTVIAASVGLASVFSGPALRASMFSVPPGMLVNAGFLLVWKHLPPKLPPHWSRVKSCLALVAASLLFWLVGASILVMLNRGGDRNYANVELTGYLTASAAFAVGLYACLAQPLQNVKGTNKVPFKNLLLRGLMAFLAIATSVLVSTIDDVAAGLSSTFPAIFLTTQVSLYLQQSSALTISSVGPMILGSISVAFYAIVFALLVAAGPSDATGSNAGETGTGLDNPAHSMNPLLGALASWSLSIVCFSIPVALFLRWRRAQSAAKAEAAAHAQTAEATTDSAAATNHPAVAVKGLSADDHVDAETAKARLAEWEAAHQLSIISKLQIKASAAAASEATPSAASFASTEASAAERDERDDASLLSVA